MNWNWPSTKDNAYFPWYMIAWHTIWAVPFYVTRVVFVGVVGIYSLNSRIMGRAWDDTR